MTRLPFEWTCVVALVATLTAAVVEPAFAQQLSLGVDAAATAAPFRYHVGRHITYVCPAISPTKDVVAWGTDVYTYDSVVCVAAIHAGRLRAGQPGAVTFTMGPGANSFRGSPRNGVTSDGYGPYDSSFTFDGGAEPGRIDNMTTLQLPEGFASPVAVVCPPLGSFPQPLWGTDVYSEGSSICAAAAHSRLITLAAGGPVVVIPGGSQPAFKGSVRNGVTSENYDEWPKSFTVAAVGSVSAVAPQTPVSTTSALNTRRDGIAVTLRMGTAGPIVTWAPYRGASGYTVSRSKSDDLNCCNATSGRNWGATSPWQDSPLPKPGIYLYTVTANMGAGAPVQGQAMFDFNAPGVTPPIAGNAGIPSTSFAVTVTMTSAGPSVSWPRVPNATSYAVGRWKSDEPGCCDNSSGRTGGATSPWQDQPLPKSGTYTYVVEAVAPGGSLTAQTQFAFTMPAAVLNPTTPPATAQPIALPAPTPMPPAAPGSRTPTVVNEAPPTDPANFTVAPAGPGQARFEWTHVSGVDRYLINGPGTTNGVMVTGEDSRPNAKNTYTLSGVPAGEHTWTIASNYEPGGIRTAAGAWPKATATIAADPGTRYRIVALGFKAIRQSRDIEDAKDGHGDEVYFGAIANQTSLTGNDLADASGLPLPATTTPPNISIVLSRSHGDEAVSVPYGRIKAGTASATGGIKSGDVVPSTLDLAGATGTLQRNQFPILIWEGVLDDKTAVVVHPTLWEDDLNPVVQALWVSNVVEEAQRGYSLGFASFYGPAPESLTRTRIFEISHGKGWGPFGAIYASESRAYNVLGARLFDCTRIAVNLVRRPCEAHGVDRPIGLQDPVAVGYWQEHVVLLTKSGVENMLTSVPSWYNTRMEPVFTPGQWAPGTFVLKLDDDGDPANNEAIANYELYLRVERAP